MFGTPVLGLIVVLWLFVLAPIALRSRKPIRHTNEAFEETRVIHEGGNAVPVAKRRPKFAATDVHAHDEVDPEYEIVEAEDVLIDEPGDTAPRISGLSSAFSKFKRSETVAEPAEIVDGHVVAELPEAERADSELDDEYESESDDAYADVEDSEYYDYDDAYTNPADFLHDDADYGELEADEEYDEAFENEDEAEAESEELNAELSEEDLEFAARRRGRGGYDPEADAAAASNRFQRRQRTLMTLGAFVVFTLVIAAVLGGWAWLAPAGAVALTIGYLYVLRQQVRAEQRLRARRIRHMRRARLGVRSAESQELGLPPRLRRPGAVVLELDDESPDFEYLPATTAYFDEDDAPIAPVSDIHAPRRVS